MNSKYAKITALPSAFLALCCVALPQQPKFIRDKAGSMEIRDFKSASTKQPDENHLSFLVKGNPVVGEWKRQKMTFFAAVIDGIASRGAKNEYVLDAAKMSGGVHAVILRPSRVQASSQEQKLTIDSQSADYTGTANRLDLAGGVKIVRDDPGAKQGSTMAGSKATVVLYPFDAPTANHNVKTAHLDGPVSFSMVSSRQVKSGAGALVARAFTIKGKADRMDYDDVERTITLTGNVEVDGDDPILLGDLAASKAVITLDALGNATQIDLEGSPGKTRLREPKNVASRPPGTGYRIPDIGYRIGNGRDREFSVCRFELDARSHFSGPISDPLPKLQSPPASFSNPLSAIRYPASTGRNP